MKTKLIFIIILVNMAINSSCKKNTAIETHNYESTQAKLTFINSNTVNFGNIPHDTLLTAQYEFHNSGKDTLHIKNIIPSCSCTNYFISNDIIPPSDTAYISLQFNSANKEGYQKIYTFVNTNTQLEKYKLTIIANVKVVE